MTISNWRPTATRETLELRASLMQEIREYFALRDVLEVETPALSASGTTDTALDALAVTAKSLPAARGFLQTSPEYAMKRLLAAGSGDIYQVCRVFRDGETGRWHEPEFTLLEWYRVGWDDRLLMAEVEELLTRLLAPRRALSGSASLRYWNVFHSVLGIDSSTGETKIREAITAHGIDVPADIDSDAMLDLALSEIIAPSFDPRALTFLIDYPVSQASLAKIKNEDPPVAARFEAFCNGIELANGYAELTDAGEQRARFEADLADRRAADRPTPPLDEQFLAALASGLPDCAGVAVGLDRVVALAAGLDAVGAAVAFSHE
ncbi:MAG: EF-P lysine aminoacylase EpmA [Gammaproteobacteria bacterium]